MAKKTKIETAKINEEVIEKAAPEKAAPTFAIVKGGCLNIRKSHSLDADIVGVLQDGEKVEIIEKGKEWSKINKGYIKNEFLVF